jgi:hypothetical protein
VHFALKATDHAGLYAQKEPLGGGSVVLLKRKVAAIAAQSTTELVGVVKT